MNRGLFAGLMIVTMMGSACAQWFTGGTLHKSTLREWNSATQEDRLATVADILCATSKVCDPEVAKPRAIVVRACVSKVAADKRRATNTVAETALLCAIDAGYVRLK